MSKITPFKIEMPLIEHINNKILYYKNRSVCEEDDEVADKVLCLIYESKAEALQELRDEICNRIDITSLIGQIKTP